MRESSSALFFGGGGYCSASEGEYDKQEVVFGIYLLDVDAEKVRYCSIRAT